MEDTLADTANVLAELATDDFLAGRIDDGRFAARVRGLADRDIDARIWGFRKHSSDRSEEHTSELQSLMRISYAVFCLKKKKKHIQYTIQQQRISKTNKHPTRH